MEREFVNEPLGKGGRAILGIDKGMLKVESTYPLAELVTPVKTFVKGIVPGEKYDKYVDDVFDAIFKVIGIDMPEAPAAELPKSTAPQG